MAILAYVLGYWPMDQMGLQGPYRVSQEHP